MEYKMEELIPIVGQLTAEYTGHASTSVTYETAEQLMEAVLYCIRQVESSGGLSVQGQPLSARRAYDTGRILVEEKTRAALRLYNEIRVSFRSYGNSCLYDTVVKGLPEFFKWYDVRFCPQDSILTLDYPVLKDLSGYQGVDRIYEFLYCIRLEQGFLGCFSQQEILELLTEYSSEPQGMIDNLCEAVLTVWIKRQKKDPSVDALRNLLQDLGVANNDIQAYLLPTFRGIVRRIRNTADR